METNIIMAPIPRLAVELRQWYVVSFGPLWWSNSILTFYNFYSTDNNGRRQTFLDVGTKGNWKHSHYQWYCLISYDTVEKKGDYSKQSCTKPEMVMWYVLWRLPLLKKITPTTQDLNNVVCWNLENKLLKEMWDDSRGNTDRLLNDTI